MDIEAYFIKKLIQSGITKGLGDDGVVFSSKNSCLSKNFCLPNDISSPVYAMDLFWEGVHFKKEWLSAKEIAYKAFLVNISDILVMNATPKYALLGVCFPRNTTKEFINAFIDGIKKSCQEFKIKLIGGDTIAGSQIGISISLIGEANKRVLFRKGAQKKDLIMHTGKVGGSYLELKRLLRGGKGKRQSRFYLPKLRVGFIAKVARFAHMGMDISDGVYSELNRLSQINQLRFQLDCFKSAYKSGEEYELLFCIPPKDFLRTKRIAKIYRLHLEVIGKVLRGKNHYRTPRWH